MAKVELNSAIGTLSGKVDGWVYRTQNGRTVVTAPPPPKDDLPTEAQQKGRERFRAAQAYAAGVLADPVLRRVYQKLGVERKRPPNALLISNFMTPPVIELVDVAEYSGRAGERIQVVATDAIEVVEVTIRIRRVAGEVVESGSAVKDHGVWRYRATASVPVGADWQIDVVARNRAKAEVIQTTPGP
jgi:hypothetical protein